MRRWPRRQPAAHPHSRTIEAASARGAYQLASRSGVAPMRWIDGSAPSNSLPPTIAISELTATRPQILSSICALIAPSLR